MSDSIETEQILHFLKNTPLFADLSSSSLANLASVMKSVQYPSGTVIAREGATGNSMGIIQSGKVEVKKKDPLTGIDFVIAVRGEGTPFGEMALLTGKPRSATVTALEATTMLTLTRSEFRKILTTDPVVSLNLARLLAEQLAEAAKLVGVDYVHLSKLSLDPNVANLLPPALMERHKIVPVTYNRNSLKLAMVNPSDLAALDDVHRLIPGVAIEPAVCTEQDFRKFMDVTYPKLTASDDKEKNRAVKPDAAKTQKTGQSRGMESFDALQEEVLKVVDVQEEPEQAASVTDITAASEEAPVVRLANNILARGVKSGASDIHIEPQERGLVLRFRVDGVMREECTLERKIQSPLISRLKIMAKLDIAERRLPQDGRIAVKIEDKAIDFRVSTVPAKFGERVVMRVLDKSGALVPLDKVFVHTPTLEKVRGMIQQPYGIIYVCGPTGSGKTTTLYSSLKEINTPDVNILTAEDPIEYDLAGISQIQTNKDIELDFARVLRAFLRQDPDVILVGETRDPETAKTAIEAALTGHLVFTTLHTNDAPGAFTRLEQMGIEPFLMSSSSVGIIAQRLARRLCQNCKVPAETDRTTLGYFGLTPESAPTFYKGTGCDICKATGYKGRVGIYEVLVMNDTLRGLVASGAKTEEIREAAVKAGMKTLKDYALILMTQGLTSLEEVLSAVVVSA